MSRGIFIAGTGTDIGKTFVTALVVKKLREKGLNAGYYKPALSGAYLKDEKLIAGDSEYVCRVSGIKEDPNSLVSYIYQAAVSPHLAAAMEDDFIDPDVIQKDFNSLKNKFDFITAEGCGGIVCPLRIDAELNHDKTIDNEKMDTKINKNNKKNNYKSTDNTKENNNLMLTDVIKMLKTDVLLVCASGLGTINSTVLTAEYALQKGINIKGIIMNEFDEANIIHSDNKKQIEYLTNIPVIACVSKDAQTLDIDVSVLKDMYTEV